MEYTVKVLIEIKNYVCPLASIETIDYNRSLEGYEMFGMWRIYSVFHLVNSVSTVRRLINSKTVLEFEMFPLGMREGEWKFETACHMECRIELDANAKWIETENDFANLPA